MTELRPYQPEDLEEIQGWLRGHKAEGCFPMWSFPTTGFISPGLAVGFLYQTDSLIALWENFASNPKANVVERRKAMTAIGKRLEAVAKERGYKFIVALTTSKSLADLLEKVDCRLAGNFMVYGKEI